MRKFFASGLVQLLVFGLLGASIWAAAGLSLFAFVFWHSDLSRDTLREMAGLFITLFPYAVVFACAIAAFDFMLGLSKMPYRLMATALVGLCSMVWMFLNLGDPLKLASVGLLGALPAALCSWLCAEIAERKLAGNWPSPPQASAPSPG
jgi:hypothetical protein